ncbi:uncharacterized protein LOC133814671 [Humulus lupulus]|uniref:uncharacterized protein LOC133814671 n=1 Tax=Humulus lupulus TaxID=3486 RepID=UPI002B41109C|nr:uncharacterized protein LOC133814671 [Humulus lupulus]
MSAEDPFNMYSEPDPVTPASKKKGSRQHRGESSSNPPTKKAQTEDPPIPVPSKETTPPPAPVDQTSPPAPVDQTPPPAPADQTLPDQKGKTLEEALMNIALISAKDRVTKLSRHRHSRESISDTDSLEVDQIFSRALNEVLSGVLTMSTGWRRSEALNAKYEKRLGEQLKIAKAKYVEEASKLQDELTISRKENDELEERVKLLEETNTKDLERFKGATFKCFYMFWKNNREANFDYLPKHMRQFELTRCLARLEEEEKAQESPEISLATGIDGVDEEAGASIDQQIPQDPSAAP